MRHFDPEFVREPVPGVLVLELVDVNLSRIILFAVSAFFVFSKLPVTQATSTTTATRRLKFAFLVELQRAKHASEAEKIVMTSPFCYDVTVLRPHRLFGKEMGVSISPAISAVLSYSVSRTP